MSQLDKVRAMLEGGRSRQNTQISPGHLRTLNQELKRLNRNLERLARIKSQSSNSNERDN
jgi:hypothetical protein